MKPSIQEMPPRYSFVDEFGRRFISLDIDIMVNDGVKFFATFRYTTRVNFDLSLGRWYVNCEDLEEKLIERYPSLKKRKDICICLDDAKIVKQTVKVQKYEKNRKLYSSSSEFEKRCLCIKG